MLPICPECDQGKHINCDGTAYDNENDVIAACECWLTDHNI